MSERTVVIDRPAGEMVHYSDFPPGGARVALRVGEMLTFAAQKHGLTLELPNVALEDHWMNLHSKNVMGAIRANGDEKARQALKEVRKQVNEGIADSESKKELLEHIGELMRGLSPKKRTAKISDLPSPEGFKFVR